MNGLGLAGVQSGRVDRIRKEKWFQGALWKRSPGLSLAALSVLEEQTAGSKSTELLALDAAPLIPTKAQ